MCLSVSPVEIVDDVTAVHDLAKQIAKVRPRNLMRTAQQNGEKDKHMSDICEEMGLCYVAWECPGLMWPRCLTRKRIIANITSLFGWSSLETLRRVLHKYIYICTGEWGSIFCLYKLVYTIDERTSNSKLNGKVRPTRQQNIVV